MVSKNQDAASTENVNPESIAAPIDGLAEDVLGADASKLLEMFGGPSEVASIANVLGNGFGVVSDKMLLVNRPFVILKYGTHMSEQTGGEFATIHVVTSDGEKWIINDGSTGIKAQLEQIKNEHGTVCPLRVPRGLRVSEYEVVLDGKNQKAKTFYLNTSN